MNISEEYMNKSGLDTMMIQIITIINIVYMIYTIFSKLFFAIDYHAGFF